MKKNNFPIYLIILMVVGVTFACALPGSTQEKPTTKPQAINTQQSIADGDPTEAIIPSPVPTFTFTVMETEPPASSQNSGQISYMYEGNLWRYLVDSSEIFQVTSFGMVGEHGTGYPRALFSPDGRYLAFNMGDGSWIQDFETDNIIDISPYVQFFTWQGEGYRFYAIQGDLECPDIEDLEDQELINFDIVRFSVEDLSSPTFIANIGGGLRFIQAISPNGEWASINICGCYSECGPASLWHLPTLNVITPPAGMDVGNFDFSPDSQQMTISLQQMFGYVESALNVANTDYSEMIEVFSAPNTAPLDARWSPDGEWIAFTTVIFADDEFTEIDRCVSLIRPDGSQESVVECTFAELATWSPDGTQLLYSQNGGSLEQFFIYDLMTGTKTPIAIQVDPYTKGYIIWGRLP